MAYSLWGVVEPTLGCAGSLAVAGASLLFTCFQLYHRFPFTFYTVEELPPPICDRLFYMMLVLHRIMKT